MRSNTFKAIIFAFLIIKVGLVFSSEKEFLKVSENKTPLIELCHKGKCNALILPEIIKKNIDDGYRKITSDHLNAKIPIVIFTLSTEGAVNVCSRIYRVDSAKKNLVELVKNTDICNYSIRNNFIISKYRDAASWTEDVYRVREEEAMLIIRDRCTGCDQVFRTKFKGSVVEKSIVSNESKFELRVPLFLTIKSKKASLYSEPNESAKTKIHLIRGDKVYLLDYINTEQCWYLARYPSKSREIDKWIKCSDFLD